MATRATTRLPTVAELVAASTARSGVPTKLTDPTALARVARLLLGEEEATDGGKLEA